MDWFCRDKKACNVVNSITKPDISYKIINKKDQKDTDEMLKEYLNPNNKIFYTAVNYDNYDNSINDWIRVYAIKNGQIIGHAQITIILHKLELTFLESVNVLEGNEGKGVCSTMVSLLAKELKTYNINIKTLYTQPISEPSFKCYLKAFLNNGYNVSYESFDKLITNPILNTQIIYNKPNMYKLIFTLPSLGGSKYHQYLRLKSDNSRLRPRRIYLNDKMRYINMSGKRVYLKDIRGKYNLVSLSAF